MLVHAILCIIFPLFFFTTALGESPSQHLIVDLYINNQHIDDLFSIFLVSDEIWVNISDWNRLPTSESSKLESKEIFGEKYVLLPKNYNAIIDFADLILKIELPADDMKINAIKNKEKTITHDTSSFAFYWNYFLLANHDPIANQGNFSSGHKTVLITPQGFLSNTMSVSLGTVNKIARLETYYNLDFPNRNLRLILGDSATEAPNWSSNVAIGGFKLQKGFLFNQGIISYPTIYLSGALPRDGQVEIRMNDSIRFQQDLKMGRFTLDHIGLPIGAQVGEIITRDMNGVLSTLPFSYYADPGLLKAGLNNFSYSAGFIRYQPTENLFNYKEFAGILNHKVGLTNWWTLGLHGQFSKEMLLLGNEQRFRLFDFGSTAISSAFSIRDNNKGFLLAGEINFNKFAIDLRLKGMFASRGYRPLDILESNSKNQTYLLNSALRFDNKHMKNTLFSFIFIDRGTFQESLIGVNQGLSFGNYIYLNLNAGFDFISKNLQAFALLSISLDPRQSLSFLVEENKNKFRASANYAARFQVNELNRVTTAVSTGIEKSLFGRASIGFDNNYFQSKVGIFGEKNAFSYHAQLAGSWGIIKNKFFLSKPVQNGIALVQIPNLPGVRVLRENTVLIGETDRFGTVLIPDLIPYYPTKLTFDTNSLDPSIQIDELTKEIVISSGNNTAHAINLKASRIMRIIFSLHHENTELSSGTKIIFGGEIKESFVGQNGDIYTEIADGTEFVEGHDENNICFFRFPTPQKTNDIVQKIGVINCK